MTTITDARVRGLTTDEPAIPPSWVGTIFNTSDAARTKPGVLQSANLSLISATLANANSLGALDLQHAVCELYLSIAGSLSASNAAHPVRLWNFIPGIHGGMNANDSSAARMDRYMAFNAGRYAAYSRWYGVSEVGPQVATATGVGHSGRDLLVHCLASRFPGRPVENPRQVPAYRYSKRRGPLPPVFARATRVDLNGEPTLLVGGTASVIGESSVHIGDLHGQTLETFHNMASLIAGKAIEPGPSTTRARLREVLGAYRTLRVHCVHRADIERTKRLVDEYFTSLESVEYVRADICRRTLLVEIEGTASLRGM